MSTKLYTKSGDSGKSGLISGLRLPKHHPLFNLLGDLDELNSSIGLAVTQADKKSTKELQRIQHQLLNIGAIIAGSPKSQLFQSQTTWLEKRIDFYQSQFDDNWYQNFLLPGGSELAARLDLARSICRRSERSLSELLEKKDNSLKTQDSRLMTISTFLNRLSDYLFALRCYLNFQLHHQETQHK